MSATAAIASGLATFGPEIIRAAGSMFGDDDTKAVADTAAKAVESATGDDDPEAAIEAKIADLDADQIKALQSVKTRVEEIRADERKHARESRTERHAQTNETVRAGIKSDSLMDKGRQAIVWIMAFGFGGLLAGLAYAIFDDPGRASEVVSDSTILLSVMASVIGAELGNQSRERQRSAGGTPGKGVLEAMADRISRGAK